MRLARFALLILTLLPSCLPSSVDIDFMLQPDAALADTPFEGTIRVFGDVAISFTEVHDLRCEGCTVESHSLVGDGIAVRLTREGPGIAELFLEAGTTRGDFSEVLQVAFVEASSIYLQCVTSPPTLACPSADLGVFVGARFGYSTTVGADSPGPSWSSSYVVEAPVTVSVSDGLSVEETDPGTFEFVATEPGLQEVSFTSGEAWIRVPIRVALEEEVESVDFHLSPHGIGFRRSDPMRFAEYLGDPLSAIPEFNTQSCMLVSTLPDGERVIGGAAVIASRNPEVLETASLETGSGWWEAQLAGQSLGTAVVTTTLGEQTFSTTIEVTPGPSRP